MNRKQIVQQISSILAAGNHQLKITAAEKRALKQFDIDPLAFIQAINPIYAIDGDTTELRAVLDRLDPIRKDITGGKQPYLIITTQDAKL